MAPRLALACTITAFLGLSGSASHPATKPSAPEQGPSQAGCGPTCGEERWAVKTLSDSDASTVNFTPVPQTVAGLVALPAPTGNSETSRLNATERTTFKVHARLVGYKIEFDSSANKGDRDFHIVIADIQDPTQTMVVEVPDPQCGGVCASAKLNDIKRSGVIFQRTSPARRPRANLRWYAATWRWMSPA